MRLRPPLFALVALAALATTSLAVAAQDYHAGPLTIEQPWARPSIGESTNSAAYMKLTNGGDARRQADGGQIRRRRGHDAAREPHGDGVMKMVHLPTASRSRRTGQPS